MAKQMPIIPSDVLTGDAKTYALAISNKGRLRASKPPVEYAVVEKNGRKLRQPVSGGEAAYVWRIVAFQVSTKSQHHCMPCTADFDIACEGYQARREITKGLDIIVKQIVDAIPASEWHGIRRWGNAMGMLGTPVATTEGAIVYR